jgi:hypothetical protein
VTQAPFGESSSEILLNGTDAQRTQFWKDYQRRDIERAIVTKDTRSMQWYQSSGQLDRHYRTSQRKDNMARREANWDSRVEESRLRGKAELDAMLLRGKDKLVSSSASSSSSSAVLGSPFELLDKTFILGRSHDGDIASHASLNEGKSRGGIHVKDCILTRQLEMSVHEACSHPSFGEGVQWTKKYFDILCDGPNAERAESHGLHMNLPDMWEHGLGIYSNGEGQPLQSNFLFYLSIIAYGIDFVRQRISASEDSKFSNLVELNQCLIAAEVFNNEFATRGIVDQIVNSPILTYMTDSEIIEASKAIPQSSSLQSMSEAIIASNLEFSSSLTDIVGERDMAMINDPKAYAAFVLMCKSKGIMIGEFASSAPASSPAPATLCSKNDDEVKLSDHQVETKGVESKRISQTSSVAGVDASISARKRVTVTDALTSTSLSPSTSSSNVMTVHQVKFNACFPTETDLEEAFPIKYLTTERPTTLNKCVDCMMVRLTSLFRPFYVFTPSDKRKLRDWYLNELGDGGIQIKEQSLASFQDFTHYVGRLTMNAQKKFPETLTMLANDHVNTRGVSRQTPETPHGKLWLQCQMTLYGYFCSRILGAYVFTQFAIGYPP